MAGRHIFISNGHVYPEVDSSHLDAPYAEHKYLYRNLRNGQFEEVTSIAGTGMTDAAAARGCAFGDYDNDGDIDIVVNCVNSYPQLLRCDATIHRNFIKIRPLGKKSNRTGIGARVTVIAQVQADTKEPLRQIDEVRSGGSYYSQNDLRLHFGLGEATRADTVEIAWPSGSKDVLHNLAANELYVIEEGGTVLRHLPIGSPVGQKP